VRQSVKNSIINRLECSNYYTGKAAIYDRNYVNDQAPPDDVTASLVAMVTASTLHPSWPRRKWWNATFIILYVFNNDVV